MDKTENIPNYNCKINIDQIEIGGPKKIFIGGPCAIESEKKIKQIADMLRKLEIPIMRAGASKLRTSIDSFQGMGIDGLALLGSICKEYGLKSISEITDPRQLEFFQKFNIDIIQVGSRNIMNYPLLKEIGNTRTPILFKRGFMTTIKEMILASEYILSGGNNQIIFCERGIRTFETATRNTLDLSFVPLIKKAISVPIIIDLSHSLGRTDIILPMAKAALAAGCDGLMIEVHPNPKKAKSDGKQSMSIPEFETLFSELKPFISFLESQ
jgi:3-deoxy-7-phosphoheptulonate synthase